MDTVFALLVILALVGIVIKRQVKGLERARQERSTRLAERESLEEGEWIARYLPRAASAEYLPAILDVCRALGDHLGITWTKLRPDDSFTGALSVEPPDDEELFEFEMFLEDWVRKHNLEALRGVMPGKLGDWLSLLLTHLEKQKAGIRESGT